MSLVKVVNENYYDIKALYEELHYQLRTKQSTCYSQETIFYSGYGVCLVSIDTIIRDFQFIKSYFNKENGNLFHHFIISLHYSNINLDKKKNESRELYMRLVADLLSKHLYYEKGFQNLYFIHLDNESNVHAHFIMNSINIHTGNRINHAQEFYNGLLCFLKEEFNFLQWEESVLYGNL